MTESSSKLQNLKPVPTAPAVFWGSVRAKLIPALMLVGLIALIINQWKHIEAPGIPAVAEGMRSVVVSPQMGTLQRILVNPYDQVRAGDPVAVVLPMDPRLQLDLLQSELQIARMGLEPSISDRNALDYERLRLSSMQLRMELAVARVNLQRAENALRRSTALRQDNLVSEDAYELSLVQRDMLTTEVEEKTRTLEDIESRLEALRPLAENLAAGTNSVPLGFAGDLREQLNLAQTNYLPIILRAPISGMVNAVTRQAGEFLPEGEPLIGIASYRSERVVGYLRQPYAIEPEIGLKVQVQTRDRQRRRFEAEISQVGAQFEMITNSLSVLRPGLIADFGLPIVVNVPAGVNIRPGETVDIHFLPGRQEPLRSTAAVQRLGPKL